MPPVRILFVCLGNICRSPLAEGIFRHVAESRGLEVVVDSAGTAAGTRGEPPDPRAIAIAAEAGIDISGLAARQVSTQDFARFDLILAMDRANLRDLSRLAPAETGADLHLFMDHAGLGRQDVPDPYHGDRAAFASVYTMLLAGSERLADRLVATGARPAETPPRRDRDHRRPIRASSSGRSG